MLNIKQNIIAIIPARSGSKSIKNKNIKKFNNLPLLAWSIKTCLACKKIKKVYVSTDSKKYANIAKKYGDVHILLRPKQISTDKSTDYEMIKHAIKNIKFDYSIILHFRPTTPLRNINIINKVINLFVNSKYSSLRTIHESPESAYKSFEIKKKYIIPICKSNKTIDSLNAPRQNFKKTYSANGYLDIYRKKFITKNNKLFGKNVKGFITPFTHEIDNLEQFNYLEYLCEKKL